MPSALTRARKVTPASEMIDQIERINDLWIMLNSLFKRENVGFIKPVERLKS